MFVKSVAAAAVALASFAAVPVAAVVLPATAHAACQPVTPECINTDGPDQGQPGSEDPDNDANRNNGHADKSDPFGRP